MQNRYVFFFVLLVVGMHPWGIIADNVQEKNATSLRKKIIYGAIVTLAIGGVICCLRPGAVPGGAVARTQELTPLSTNSLPSTHYGLNIDEIPVVIPVSMQPLTPCTQSGSAVTPVGTPSSEASMPRTPYVNPWTMSALGVGKPGHKPYAGCSTIESEVPILLAKPALQLENKDGNQTIMVTGRTEIQTLGKKTLYYLMVSEQERYLSVKQKGLKHALWCRRNCEGEQYYYESKTNPFQADCGPCSIALMKITPDRYMDIYMNGWQEKFK